MSSAIINGPTAQPFPLLGQLVDEEVQSVKTFWEQAVKEQTAEDDLLKKLRDALKVCLKYQGKNREDESKAAARSPHTTTLQGQLEDVLAYDDKVLRLEHKKTLLLKEAVELYNKRKWEQQELENKSRTIEKSNVCMIIKALCHLDPKRAFKPYTLEGSKKSPEISAFQYAAESGAQGIIDIMLNELQLSVQNEEVETSTITSTGYPSQEFQRETVLPTIEKNTTEVVEVLLKTFAKLSEVALMKAMSIFKLMIERNPDLLSERIWETAVTTLSPQVVSYLLEMKDSKFCTKSHALFVVQNGTAMMWNKFPAEARRKFLSETESGLLHEAVKCGKVDIVGEILKQDPTQIEATLTEKYPLECLQGLKDSNIEDRETRYKEIRNLLVHAMIRSQSLGIQAIRDILRSSKVEANEMSFHFPQFKSDTKNESSTDYVRGLTELTKISPDFFRFESVLKYAMFPNLSGPTLLQSSDDFKQDHKEVKDTLDWLKDRGVHEVINLYVGDRLHCPHDDDHVAQCVTALKVRVLNWKKLDIYLNGLTEVPIEELHLYSSGNRSVHDQWVSQLPKFKQLRKLYVYVVKDVLSSSRAERVSDELEGRLTALNKKLGCKWKSREDDDNEIPNDSPEGKEANDPTGETKDSMIKVYQILWVQQQETIAYRSPDSIMSGLVGSHLAVFIKKFFNHYAENWDSVTRQPRKSKVALIDSGVVVVGGQNATSGEFGSSLAKRIVEGISLVSRDNEEQAWWHATDPHGTQMATIICSINPCCDLYVVKVAESNASGITGHNVAKAIEWARKKGVDVISLSLVAFADSNQEMRDAIKKAKNDDIIICCSTADEGGIGAHSVGENNDYVLSIAACDKWGNLLPQSRKTGFDYSFVGHNIHVGQLPYLKSDESIKGSSVSTAIAAGMASLILACARISSSLREENLSPGWRFETAKNYFDSMVVEGQWVVLDKLCGIRELEKRYDFVRLMKGEAFLDKPAVRKMTTK